MLITSEMLAEAILQTSEDLKLDGRALFPKETGKNVLYSFSGATHRFKSEDAKALIINLLNTISKVANYPIPDLKSLSIPLELNTYRDSYGSARGSEKSSGVLFSIVPATQLTLFTYVAYPNITLTKERGTALYNNRKRVLKFSLQGDSAKLEKAIKYSYTYGEGVEEEGVEPSDWRQASFSYIQLANQLREQIKELLGSNSSEAELSGDIKYALQLFFASEDPVVLDLDLKDVDATSNRLGLLIANESRSAQTANIITLLHTIAGTAGVIQLNDNLECEGAAGVESLNFLINPWYLEEPLLQIEQGVDKKVVALDLVPARTELEGYGVQFAEAYVLDKKGLLDALSFVLNAGSKLSKRLSFSVSNIYALPITITGDDIDGYFGQTVGAAVVNYFRAPDKQLYIPDILSEEKRESFAATITPAGDSVKVRFRGSAVKSYDVKMRLAPVKVSRDTNAEFFHLVESVSIGDSVYALDAIFRKTEHVDEAVFAVLLASAYRNTVIQKDNEKLSIGFYLTFLSFYESVNNPDSPFSTDYMTGLAGSDRVKSIFFKG